MNTGRARSERSVVKVINETRTLFHRLKVAAEALHRQGQTSGGRRGVLMSLRRHGPQTVPQLARARPVSRQHIQMLVNPLAEEGLVELIDNPVHKRSKLVRLTSEGRLAVDEIERREQPVLDALSDGLERFGVEDSQLEQTAKVLSALGALLEDQRVKSLLEGEGA